MDLSQIYSNIYKYRKALGIHIDYTNKGIAINVLELKRKASLLHISSNSSFDSLESIDNKFRNLPANLIITGNKVVYKKVVSSSEDEMLAEVIPLSKKSDFIYRIYPIDDNKSWVVIVRKAIIINVLKEIKEKKIFVCNIELGPFSLCNITSLLDVSDSKIHIANNTLLIENDNIIDIVQSDEKEDYSIDGECLNSTDLLSYSAAISYYISGNKGGDEEFKTTYEEYGYYRKIKIFLTSLAVVLLISLTVNFMMFSSYRVEQTYLKQTASLSKSELVRLDSLKSKIAYYKSLIKRNSLDRKTIHSYICDRLIMRMPNGIILRRLSINAPKKKILKNDLIKYTDSHLIIKGQCKSPRLLEIWLKNIRDEEFLDLVIGHEYYSKAGIGEFRIDLQLK